MKGLIFSALVCTAVLIATNQANSRSGENWPHSGCGSGSTRSSSMRQITLANVVRLKVALTHGMRPAGFPKPDVKTLGARLQATQIRQQGIKILFPGAPETVRGAGGPVETAPRSQEGFAPILVGKFVIGNVASGIATEARFIK